MFVLFFSFLVGQNVQTMSHLLFIKRKQPEEKHAGVKESRQVVYKRIMKNIKARNTHSQMRGRRKRNNVFSGSCSVYMCV